MNATYSKGSYKENLRIIRTYYKRLFPFKELAAWLGYGNVTVFIHREFAFRLHNDLLIRYETFASTNHFRTRILGEIPKGIDIGAVYNRPHLYTSSYKAFMERELVFDIDVSDYDHVRSCCKGRRICKHCWRYIVIACKILNTCLKSDFGYSRMLWIFSGRRGIHCWVCDKSARMLKNRKRSCIIDHMVRKYVTVLGRGKPPEDKLDYYDRRLLKVIEPEFVPLCIKHYNLLGKKAGVEYFLNQLPDNEARTDVQQLFTTHQSSIDRWNAFVAYHNEMISSEVSYWQGWEEYIDLLKIHYCRPRFDSNVTQDVIHLLKCPFSVHPESGKIAIPFNVAEVESFDPSSTPTLKQLIDEIAIADKDSSSKEKKEDISVYQKTSLKEPMDIFKRFVEKWYSECTY